MFDFSIFGPRYEANGEMAYHPPHRVLVITYTFPPVGGAGVQRVTKFVKYLPKHGWVPTVLTVANPSVPVLDYSLACDIPGTVEVVRTKSLEPGYALKRSLTSVCTAPKSGRAAARSMLTQIARSTARVFLQPDPQILWYRSAVAAGKRMLRSSSFDAIFATAPPFSTFLIGRALSRSAGLPLLIDYRDEWTISNEYLENKKLGPIASAFQSRMENQVLRAAKSVIATTQASANSIQERCLQAGANASVSCIYNGYDPEDFAALPLLQKDSSRLRIVYTGTLWHLTSIAPLVQAMRSLRDRNPLIAGQLEFVIVGRKVGAQNDHVKSLLATGCGVVEHDYMDHKKALGMLRSGDIACLLLSDVPGAERVVPAKLFEYIASERPILAIIPNGEAWNLLEGMPNVSKFSPQEVTGISTFLESAVSRSGEQSTSRGRYGFDRDSQAKQLADRLSAMLLATSR